MLMAFFALSFGLSWGLLAAFLAWRAPIEALFGPMGYTNPLFVLAVYAPAIAGLFVVWRLHGARGLGGFVRRLGLWRMPWPWWALLVAGLPAVMFAGAAIKGTWPAAFPFSPWTGVLPALLTTLVIGPIEEFGWRGVALPLLQQRLAPLWAGLLLGAVWALWHVPAFFLAGTPQSDWSLPGFVLGCVALSVILTPMFNASGGSLLVAVLFHFQVNGPVWPDAQPWDSLIFAALALVVVVINRERMLDRNAGATALLREDGAPRMLAAKHA